MGSLPRTPQMGVYAITHTPTGQQYIGASIDIAKRWQGHRAALKRGDHGNRLMQEAWNATTPDEWSWTVIEDVADRTLLACREQYWIDRLTPVLRHPWRRPWRNRDYPFDAERFWARVHKSENCWEWTGCLSSMGYGKVSYRGQSGYVHRLAWVLTYGPIGEEMWVLHRCDNRRCCRPDHLFLGTTQQNTADMIAKRRRRNGTTPRERNWFVLHPELVPRGERAKGAKLTTEAVLDLRRRAANGESAGTLARSVGLHRTSVCRIILGQAWKHLPGALSTLPPDGRTTLTSRLSAEALACKAGLSDTVMSVRQAACVIGCSTKSILNFIHAGQLPATAAGTFWAIRVEDVGAMAPALLAHLRRRKWPQAPRKHRHHG